MCVSEGHPRLHVEGVRGHRNPRSRPVSVPSSVGSHPEGPFPSVVTESDIGDRDRGRRTDPSLPNTRNRTLGLLCDYTFTETCGRCPVVESGAWREDREGRVYGQPQRGIC